MPELTIDDCVLTYQEAGSGPALVFIHGSDSDARTWSRQVAHFSAGYRVVAYSRRFHYPNPPPAEQREYSPQRHARDLAALLEHLKLAPAHLAGSSYGGNVALQLAIDRPELVRSLAVSEPPLIGWLKGDPVGDRLYAAWRAGVARPARRAFAAGDPAAAVQAFIDGVLGAGSFASFPPDAVQRALDNAPALQAELTDPRSAVLFTPRQAAGLRPPLLLLAGAASPPLFQRCAELLAGCLPDVRFIRVPDGVHNLHSRQPAVYNRLVGDFLAGVEFVRLRG